MWTLRKIKPNKNFPSETYFWIDSYGFVRYQRSISPLGFIPIEVESIVGKRYERTMGAKLVKTKRTQEQLAKGWL